MSSFAVHKKFPLNVISRDQSSEDPNLHIHNYVVSVYVDVEVPSDVPTKLLVKGFFDDTENFFKEYNGKILFEITDPLLEHFERFNIETGGSEMHFKVLPFNPTIDNLCVHFMEAIEMSSRIHTVKIKIEEGDYVVEHPSK